mgnify:CR=1 FL=1
MPPRRRETTGKCNIRPRIHPERIFDHRMIAFVNILGDISSHTWRLSASLVFRFGLKPTFASAPVNGRFVPTVAYRYRPLSVAQPPIFDS